MHGVVRTVKRPMTATIYRREDGRFAWRIQAANGRIVATDGGQGYDRKRDARRMLEKITALAWQDLRIRERT